MGIVNNTIIYTISKVLGIIVSLLLLPIFTKKFDGISFGVVGILWVINPILTRIMNLGTDVSFSLKYYKLGEIEKSNYFFHYILITTVSFIICLLFVNIYNNEIVSYFSNKLTLILINAFVIQSFMQSIITTWISLLALQQKIIYNSIIELINPIITTGLTYLGVLYIGPKISVYIQSLLVSGAILFGISILYYSREFNISHFKFNIKILKKLLKVGLPVVPAGIAIMILSMGDRLVIKHFMGLGAVALYSYGYKFSTTLVNSMLYPFQKALTPIILKSAVHNYEKTLEYSQNIAKYFIGLFPIVLASIVLPLKYVMASMSNEMYDISYRIFLIATIGILIQGINNIYRNIFNHLERTDIGLILVTVGALLNILMNIIFVPIYGIIAAAYTTILSYYIMLIVSIPVLNYYTRINVNIFSVTGKILPFVLMIEFISRQMNILYNVFVVLIFIIIMSIYYKKDIKHIYKEILIFG